MDGSTAGAGSGLAGAVAAWMSGAAMGGRAPVPGTINSQIGGPGFFASAICGGSGWAGFERQSQFLIHVHMIVLLSLRPKDRLSSDSSRSQLKFKESLPAVSKLRTTGFYGSCGDRC